jgi:hypothetical protein
MKGLSLLPQVALFCVVAYACSDSTAPAISDAVAARTQREGVVGRPPPPPVKATVVICVTGDGCATVDAVYNAVSPPPPPPPLGAPIAAALAATDEDDIDDPSGGSGVCTFPGKASLKFEKTKKKHPLPDGVTTNKARLKCKNFVASGRGTIEYESFAGHVVVILREVTFFDNTQDCGLSATPCATFETTATVNGLPARATGNAFNREYFDSVCVGEGQPSFCTGGGS